MQHAHSQIPQPKGGFVSLPSAPDKFASISHHRTDCLITFTIDEFVSQKTRGL